MKETASEGKDCDVTSLSAMAKEEPVHLLCAGAGDRWSCTVPGACPCSLGLCSQMLARSRSCTVPDSCPCSLCVHGC